MPPQAFGHDPREPFGRGCRRSQCDCSNTCFSYRVTREEIEAGLADDTFWRAEPPAMVLCSGWRGWSIGPRTGRASELPPAIKRLVLTVRLLTYWNSHRIAADLGRREVWPLSHGQVDRLLARNGIHRPGWRGGREREDVPQTELRHRGSGATQGPLGAMKMPFAGLRRSGEVLPWLASL